MEITNELIDHLAHLSRLQFDDEAKEAIIHDLKNILHFIDTLEEVNTDGVEPLIYVNHQKNIMRTDKVGDVLSKEIVLANAPNKDSDFIKVPKVLG